MRVHNSSTCQYGKTPGSATDDDIQPSASFQPNSVDNCVKEGAKKNMEGSHPIEREAGNADTDQQE